MSKRDVDKYLKAVEEPQRSTLEKLRGDLEKILPGAEQKISYGLTTFFVDESPIAGFGAFKKHCSYFPFSGSVLNQLEDEISGYSHTKSSLHFSSTKSLPVALVKKLVKERQRQLK